MSLPTRLVPITVDQARELGRPMPAAGDLWFDTLSGAVEVAFVVVDDSDAPRWDAVHDAIRLVREELWGPLIERRVVPMRPRGVPK